MVFLWISGPWPFLQPSSALPGPGRFPGSPAVRPSLGWAKHRVAHRGAVAEKLGVATTWRWPPHEPPLDIWRFMVIFRDFMVIYSDL